jgi:hypothetical protein
MRVHGNDCRNKLNSSLAQTLYLKTIHFDPQVSRTLTTELLFRTSEYSEKRSGYLRLEVGGYRVIPREQGASLGQSFIEDRCFHATQHSCLSLCLRCRESNIGQCLFKSIPTSSSHHGHQPQNEELSAHSPLYHLRRYPVYPSRSRRLCWFQVMECFLERHVWRPCGLEPGTQATHSYLYVCSAHRQTEEATKSTIQLPH